MHLRIRLEDVLDSIRRRPPSCGVVTCCAASFHGRGLSHELYMLEGAHILVNQNESEFNKGRSMSECNIQTCPPQSYLDTYQG